MATVYLAIQASLGRPVVLKVLDTSVTENSEDLITRFLGEGRLIASLNHPNIVTIYDIGIANENDLYISMEYVQGGDLKQRLELTLSPEEALRYMVQIASALGEAHKHGIVHRDVKPANILFKDDTPLLTDFGIAKEVDTDTDLTSTGIFLGSPNYVSPEQADGIKLDGRTDLYSLGCIYFEMLSGSKPFISDSVIDIVIQHKQAPIPRLPDDLAEHQPIVDKLLAKRREDRFSDADALIEEIEKLQAKLYSTKSINELGITGEGPADNKGLRARRSKQILFGLVLMSLIMFSSLKYVEIRLKDATVNTRDVSTSTVLTDVPVNLDHPVASTADAQPIGVDGNPQATTSADPVTPQVPATEVIKALYFLGRQCLEEFKLTYPPRDNAYYYFSRLLELQPGNQDARDGILEIANRYSILAEQSMINNELEKTQAYVDLGLKINPDNEALLAMKTFVRTQDNSLLNTLKSLFK